MPSGIKQRAVRKKKYFINTVDKTLHRSRNSSIMTKKSLQSNNRALAKCLSQQKRENRNLTVELSYFIAERFELNQKIKRLEEDLKVLVDGNWNPSNLEKIAKLKTILNQVSGNVLITAQLINSVVDLFRDVNVNSCRSSVERISCVSTNEKETDTTTPQKELIINSETIANRLETNDDEEADNSPPVDEEVLKLSEAHDAIRSPVNGPKAAFDLSAISERSEFESRRSSIQSRLSVINHRRTQSVGKFEPTRRTRSLRLSSDTESDLWANTPRTVETLEKIPRDILTNVSDKDDRRSSRKQRRDEITDANHMSPFVKMIRIEADNETLRRGTFVVTNSLQTAPWPPVDSFVSTRKSSKSTSSKQLPDVENKTLSPEPALNIKRLSESNKPTEQQNSNYESKDMELTDVLDVPVELGEKSNNAESASKVVKEKIAKGLGRKNNSKPVFDDGVEVPRNGKVAAVKKEKKGKSQSKQTNMQPFVALDDVKRRNARRIRDSISSEDDVKRRTPSRRIRDSIGSEDDGKRRTSSRRIRDSISSEDDCYTCGNNFLDDAIDPHGKFSVWRKKSSSAGRLHENPSPEDSFEVVHAKRTPNKLEVKPKKSSKLKMVMVPDEKENSDVNERPRRVKSRIDYKLPSLNGKIRRAKDGSVTITNKRRVINEN
uniref:Uncharacterized protein n=1 Tax=Strigamia maritima TaxID=126957 RepID=T1IVP5_STRMM